MPRCWWPLALSTNLLLAASAQSDGDGGIIPSFGCDFSELESLMDKVELACCGADNCPGDIPNTCSVACAIVYTPFYAACKTLIHHIFDDDQNGRLKLQKFTALNSKCNNKVDMGSALNIISHFRKDDPTLLVPELDHFETYRYVDAGRGRKPFDREGQKCQIGWATSNTQNQPSQCCMRDAATGRNRCGRPCPSIPAGVSCILPNDHGKCPTFPSTTQENWNSCLRPPRDPHTGRYKLSCTPHTCARACLHTPGCLSFRWNHQQAVYSNGQAANRCGGGTSASEEPLSFCEFSKTCTTTVHASGTATPSTGTFGQTDQWHTYVVRNITKGGH
jgi:hypothetical protein